MQHSLNLYLDTGYPLETLTTILTYRAKETPNKTAYIFLEKGEEKNLFTYRTLYLESLNIAAKLQQLNLQGERILLLYPSSLDFIAAFMGCLYAGAIAVPAYPPNSPTITNRLQTIIKDCTPKAVMSLSHCNINTTELTHQKKTYITLIETDRLEKDLTQKYVARDISKQDIAFLQYTSGSTSDPKGAMITHNNIIYNTSLMQQNYNLNHNSITVSWLPIYHDMGLIAGLLKSLILGSSTIFMAPSDFIKAPLLWLKTISKYKATFSAAPNFAYDLCNMKKISPKIAATLDLSSWQSAANGAEPIKPQAISKFVKKFAAYGLKKSALSPSYGMAETTLFISANPTIKNPTIKSFDKDLLEKNNIAQKADRSDNKKRLVACGNGKMMQKLWIVDPNTLARCNDGTIGEIWVQDPSVAVGYWKKPDINHEIFNAYEENSGTGPFLRTGDLGFIFKRNHFFLAFQI